MRNFAELYRMVLPHRAISVYIYLSDRANKDGICRPSIPTISKDLKLSESTIRRALKDLYRAGLIQTEQRFRENGGNNSLQYKLWLFPKHNHEPVHTNVLFYQQGSETVMTIPQTRKRTAAPEPNREEVKTQQFYPSDALWCRRVGRNDLSHQMLPRHSRIIVREASPEWVPPKMQGTVMCHALQRDLQ